MSDLVSVVIPAYNAASRIRLTLESIIAQDYDDTEIIVVDDASSDGTGDIAREILGASGRQYRVITHEHNSGECASRNTGMKHAGGRYICFVDADDVIRGNFVSSLIRALQDGGCDISFCGLVDRFTDGRPDKNMLLAHGKPQVSPGENIILGGCVPPVWCCMYDAVFLKKYGLFFHEGCTAGGDVEFISKALCRAGRVTFIEECLYIYMHHDEMGSVRDNDTRDKKILRYEHNTQAQSSTAEYLREYAKSHLLREIAGKILMPQNVIRRLNAAAMKNDRAGYDAIIRDDEAMRVLRGGLGVFALMRKPEVFVKALMIMILPGGYYALRRGK